MRIPGKLVATSRDRQIVELVRWLNELREALLAQEPKSSPGIIVNKSTKGTTYALKQKSGGTGTGNGEARWS